MEMSARSAATEVIRTLQNLGYEAFLVGGCVRDILLGRDSKDYDVTTNARPNYVRDIFEKTIPVGAAFGVIIVVQDGHQIEVATYRADGEYTDARRPDNVVYSHEAKEDVVRRDFTMNGLLLTTPMAFAVKGVKPENISMFDGYGIVDFVGGQEDIKNKIIRCIGDANARFGEDALRMLRAVRFAAQLGFEIEQGTLDAIVKNAPLISKISRERVAMELFKLVAAPYAHRGLSYLFGTGLLRYALPEYLNAAATRTLERFLRFPSPDPLLGVAMFLADMEYSAAVRVVGGLKLSTDDRENILGAVALMAPLTSSLYMTLAEIKRLARRTGLANALLLLEQSHAMEALPNINVPQIVSMYRSLTPEEIRPKPLVTGADLIALGYTPSPLFTAILNEIETHQLNGNLKTRDDANYYLDHEGVLPNKRI
jgi:tRNA nucleotidyltransferase/poly(A) polymerase